MSLNDEGKEAQGADTGEGWFQEEGEEMDDISLTQGSDFWWWFMTFEHFVAIC